MPEEYSEISWKQILDKELSASELEKISLIGMLNGTFIKDFFGRLIFSIQPILFYKEGEINNDALVIVRLKCKSEIPEDTFLKQLFSENKAVNVYGKFVYHQQKESDIVGAVNADKIEFNQNSTYSNAQLLFHTRGRIFG